MFLNFSSGHNFKLIKYYMNKNTKNIHIAFAQTYPLVTLHYLYQTDTHTVYFWSHLRVSSHLHPGPLLLNTSVTTSQE